MIFIQFSPHKFFKKFFRTILREIFSFEKKSQKVMKVGRRVRYDGPVKRFEAWIPYDTYKEMEDLKQRMGVSWTELLLHLWNAYKTSTR